MKKTMVLAVLMFGCSMSALAWNCTAPNQVRVQVPTGTVGNGTGDGSGQVVVDSGLTFICEVLPTATPTPPSATATSGSTSTATSTNTVSNTLAQTQKQQQTQSNTSTNSNQSAGGSVSDVGNSVTTVEAPKIPVAPAYAPPVFSTTNCFKGWSAGGQTSLLGGSFGGGGIDKNCAALAAAQNLFAMGSRLAACKVILTTKAAKDAGVTMDDCMTVVQRQAPPVIPVAQPEPLQVNVYFPAAPPVVAPVVAPVVKPIAKHIAKKCKVTPALQQPMEK